MLFLYVIVDYVPNSLKKFNSFQKYSSRVTRKLSMKNSNHLISSVIQKEIDGKKSPIIDYNYTKASHPSGETTKERSLVDRCSSVNN